MADEGYIVPNTRNAWSSEEKRKYSWMAPWGELLANDGMIVAFARMTPWAMEEDFYEFFTETRVDVLKVNPVNLVPIWGIARDDHGLSIFKELLDFANFRHINLNKPEDMPHEFVFTDNHVVGNLAGCAVQHFVTTAIGIYMTQSNSPDTPPHLEIQKMRDDDFFDRLRELEV